MNLKGKIAVVTGGGQGIGRAIAEKLVEAGAKVVIGDINIKIAQNTTKEVNCNFEGMMSCYHLDITKSESISKMINNIMDEFGTVDIWVNNAGICKPFKKFEEMDILDWQQIFDVNLLGTINCIKEIIPYMKKNKCGKIINNASSAAITGGISVSPAYAVSKAGVVCLTKSLAKYLGKDNINVNAIAPGIIETAMTAKMEYNVNDITLKRFGKPIDVAGVVLFLASEESDYLTGNTIDINGGLYMR